MHRIAALGFALALSGLAVPADAEAVYAGRFEPAFHSLLGRPSVSGGWRIVRSEAGGFALEVGEDFVARKGPDVKFFLSPLPAADVTGDNATRGSVFVVQLEAFEGPQRFALPASAAPETFRTLVLHCEAYSKLWGVSALR